MNRRFRFKRICALLCAGMLIVTILPACGQAGTEDDAREYPAEASGGEREEAVYTAPDNPFQSGEMFTERDSDPTYNEGRSTVVALEGGTVTISEEGIYILKGSLTDGMVIVDAADTAKIQLVLDGVTISNSRGAAIYVREADKVFLTLAEGSVNTLSNGGSYTAIDENKIDAVVFARSDLTINGSGSLNITAGEGHGIVSKDDLKITGGVISITAARHGLSGKDSVRVAAGTLELTTGKDGIHAENADDEEKGFVYIAGGSLNMVSEGDCISAETHLQIDGGSFRLTAGKGSSNKTVAKDESGQAVSTKGIKAGGRLVVNGGDFNVDSQDDALHANDCLTVNGGTFELSTGDDGIHSDETTAITAGTIEILTSYEGIEGKAVVVTGGVIRLYARDDGLNAAGGNDGSGYKGMFDDGVPGGDRPGRNMKDQSRSGRGGMAMQSADDCYILISGGELSINADGDGLDSNGDLTVTGGVIFVSGPENGGNGALDYSGTAQITGGTVVAVGNIGMAENFGDGSTQGSILLQVSNCPAGSEVSLRDSEGNILAEYVSEKTFNSVVLSVPGLTAGKTYLVTAGTEEYEVVMESLIYGSGNGFGGMGGHGMGGFGGRPGDRDFDRRDFNGGDFDGGDFGDKDFDGRDFNGEKRPR